MVAQSNQCDSGPECRVVGQIQLVIGSVIVNEATGERQWSIEQADEIDWPAIQREVSRRIEDGSLSNSSGERVPMADVSVPINKQLQALFLALSDMTNGQVGLLQFSMSD